MGEFVYGRQALKGLLASEKRIIKLYLTDKKDPLLAQFKVDPRLVVFLSNQQMNDRFQSANHQNVVAEIEPFDYKDLQWLEKKAAAPYDLIVVLDGIEDPQNFGAIARSAWAADAKAIVIKQDRQAQVNPLAIRASAGYLLSIPIVRVVNISSTLTILKKLGYWIAGTVSGAKSHYSSLDASTPTVLVIGNEHSGISRIVKDSLDFSVSIPMANGVESLSASAAASVVLIDLYSRGLSRKESSNSKKPLLTK